MEQLKQNSHLWWPAWLAAIRYMMLTGITAFGVWLQGAQDKWDSLTSYDYWTLFVGAATAMLGALGAIMNDRWSAARKESNGTNR